MKWKRPLAVLGVILICSLYLIALISAFSHNAESKNWLMAAIYSTVVIPVFLYVFQLVARVIKPDQDHKDSGPTDKKQ